MARKKTVEIDFIADTSKATRGIKNVGDTAEAQGTKFQKMGSAAKIGFGLAAVGVGVAIDFLKDATIAAADDEAAQVDLALALKNTVDATDAQIKATEKYITKTSLATGVTDDELRPALENLVRATGDLDKAQTLLGTAMDISAAKGKPLAAITEAMGKAALGNVGALGRLGIATKDAEGNALTFEEAMAEANRTMGGAAEEAAGTGAGAMARFNVVMEEFKEGIGGPFLNALANGLDALLTFKEELDTPGTQSFWDGVVTGIKEQEDSMKRWENAWKNPVTDRIALGFKQAGEVIGLNFLPNLAEASTAMDTARHSAAGAKSGGIDPLTGATEDLGEATDDTTDSIYGQMDALRAAADPTFALVDAENDLAGAIADAKAAADEHTTKSPEYVEALDKVREAAGRVQGAESTLASTTGVTRRQMEDHLRSLQVFTDAQIDLIIADMERVNAFRFADKQVRIIYKRQPTPDNPYNIPGQHSGGHVEGQFRGQEVLRRMRVGEFVSQSGNPGHNGNGGGPEVIQLVVDGRVLADVVRREKIKDERSGRSWG